MSPGPREWRVGNHNSRHLYDPDDVERGVMFAEEDGPHAAAALTVYGDPGPGHHVLVTVDPARNNGRVFTSSGMVSIWAAIRAFTAGGTVEQVREELGITEAEAAVVAALVDDLGGIKDGEAHEQLRAVYRERAMLVAHLASLYPSVIAFSDPEAPEWPVVYVNTPGGQCSWHLSLDDLDLFGHVEQVPAGDPRARWDGHSTEEKYRRLAGLAARSTTNGVADAEA